MQTADIPLTDLDARKALEAFVVDNDDLERLETLIGEFNIFEAIGAVRHEFRHSELLAFLLDPNENHGLGDTFLRRLVQRTVAGEPAKAPFSPVDLDVWELDDVEVRREWENIDILVADPRNKIAVIIENKIDSGEHSDQLRRYWSIAEREFQGYRLLGLYLTPDGDEPSDERYIAADYGLIAELVKRFLEARSSTIGPDVKTVLRHYEQMLRRHIVSDSEIAELCRKLYRKHRHALDLIYMHRPDPGRGPFENWPRSWFRPKRTSWATIHPRPTCALPPSGGTCRSCGRAAGGRRAAECSSSSSPSLQTGFS